MFSLLATILLLVISKVHGLTDSMGYSQNPMGAVNQLQREPALSTRDGYLEFNFKQAPGGDKFRKYDWRSHGWDDNYLIAFYEQVGWSANIERILCFPMDQETGRTICPDSVKCPSVQTTEFLAHKMCRNEGFPTYSSYAYRKVQPYQLYEAFNITNYNQSYSGIDCQQGQDYEIDCELQNVRPLGWNDTCAVLLVECGPCQRYSPVWHGMELPIHSPMYPRLQPGTECVWELVGWLNRKMYFNINITDLDLRSSGSNRGKQVSQHASVLLIYAGNDLNALKEVVTISGGSNGQTFYRIENKRIVKILFKSFIVGDIMSLDTLRGFNLSISIEDHTNRDQYKTVGIVLAFPVGCFILCCFYGCVRNKCSETRRRRSTRRPRPRMTMAPIYVLEPGVGLHEQRTARFEEELLGNKVANAGDNIYMIDNSVAMRAPHPPLPSLPKVMCDVSHDENEKLYETISLHTFSDEDEVKSGLKESLSTPLLTVSQKGQVKSPECRENMSPIYLSLEAGSAQKSS